MLALMDATLTPILRRRCFTDPTVPNASNKCGSDPFEEPRHTLNFARRLLGRSVPDPKSRTNGQSVPLVFARPYGPWSLSPAAKGFCLHDPIGLWR
jgi:hypothetical protein